MCTWLSVRSNSTLALIPPGSATALSLSTNDLLSAVALLDIAAWHHQGQHRAQFYIRFLLLWDLTKVHLDSGLLRIHLKPRGRKRESIIMKYPSRVVPGVVSRERELEIIPAALMAGGV